MIDRDLKKEEDEEDEKRELTIKKDEYKDYK